MNATITKHATELQTIQNFFLDQSFTRMQLQAEGLVISPRVIDELVKEGNLDKYRDAERGMIYRVCYDNQRLFEVYQVLRSNIIGSFDLSTKTWMNLPLDEANNTKLRQRTVNNLCAKGYLKQSKWGVYEFNHQPAKQDSITAVRKFYAGKR